MGGTQNIGEASDNPVEINVTAMVDVIFCLCIFFMCSFHFKQLEGKIDAWLPKGDGNQQGEVKEKLKLEEVRRIGSLEPASSDTELVATIQRIKKDFESAGKSEVPVVVDATEPVPWQDVVHVLDLCKAERLSPIKFTEPMEYRPSNR